MKAAFIVIVIAFVITAANFGASLILTRQSLTETVNKDLTLALDIANDFVSTRISLYKSNAQIAAERLLKTNSTDEMEKAMREQLGQFTDFMAFAVFDRQSVVAEYGDSPASNYLLNGSKYIQSAFEGKTVISTTGHNEKTGKLVMYICTPVGSERVLSVTIPGMIFSDDLIGYKLWDTGNIWMIDEEGMVIAYFIPEMVNTRVDYINTIKQTGPYSTETFSSGILSNDRGSTTYIFENTEYQSVYARVTASEFGWRIGLSVPLAGNPVVRIRNNLFLLAALFFIISVIVAIMTSKYIAKHYDKVAEQNRRLEEFNEITLNLKTELEAALEEAQKANNAKSSFLVTMSHEMRTPLNAVIGLSELVLNTGTFQDETRDRLTKIYASGMTLLGIVNDILDISKIESGKFEMLPIEYATPSLINDIVSLNIVRIGEKPITFHLTVDEKLPGFLFGDDLRVKQIFNNLLTNAFKYTSFGVVEWNVSFERDGDSVWFISSVKDTGIGIKQEDVQKLFLDYSQVDARTNRKAEGAGLGLAITKRLVNMMDGDIAVESEYGKGSTFSVRLRQKFVSDVPIGREMAENLMADRFFTSKRTQSSNFGYIDLSYAHVLVVDDVPTNLDVAKGMLKPYRMRVDCAQNGRMAIDMIRAENPRYDAVFMDHMMPGMDGIEATRIIREQIGTDYARELPVFALTANAIAGNEKMFLENGFQAFISKPIDMMRLDAVLRQYIWDKGHKREIAAEKYNYPLVSRDHNTDDLPLDGMSIDGVDIADVLKRFGNRGETYIKVLQSYAVNTPPLLKDMMEYMKAGNWPEYAIVIHGVKGASLGIRAMQAGRYAEHLEQLVKDGKIEKVPAVNDAFMEYMKRLLNSINAALARCGTENRKPAADAPDQALLRELREACGEYDVGKVDRVMSQLESFEYADGAELIAWLRAQLDDMNFDEISNDEWPFDI